MNIPKQFEYVATHHQFVGRPQSPVFVTILDAFEHRYTGTRLYHIRVEHDGTFGLGGTASAFVDYKTITESELMDMLANRKEVF